MVLSSYLHRFFILIIESLHMIIYRIATQEVPREDLTPQQLDPPSFNIDFDQDFDETNYDNIQENYSRQQRHVRLWTG